MFFASLLMSSLELIIAISFVDMLARILMFVPLQLCIFLTQMQDLQSHQKAFREVWDKN